MYQPPSGYETVLSTQQRQECMEARFVLEAAGLSAEVLHRNGWWFLVAADGDVQRCVDELDAYRDENPASTDTPRVTTTTYGGSVPAYFAYAATLVIVAILAATEAYGFSWFAAGRMQAGEVMAGQWWRTVTALTLHLDLGHLAGNLVFGAVFGVLAGRILGGGVAWLVIVSAGALGNLINAMIQAPTHTSIGASTAVFAALGVMVANALRPRVRIDRSNWSAQQRLKSWSPLIAGVVLLAFTGIGGERTDVMAHVTGFTAGLLFGWIGSCVPTHWLASERLQAVTGLAALAFVVTAWAAAYLSP